MKLMIQLHQMKILKMKRYRILIPEGMGIFPQSQKQIPAIAEKFPSRWQLLVNVDKISIGVAKSPCLGSILTESKRWKRHPTF
jgi:hypothetical protein